jgi:hypothetical protein
LLEREQRTLGKDLPTSPASFCENEKQYLENAFVALSNLFQQDMLSVAHRVSRAMVSG